MCLSIRGSTGSSTRWATAAAGGRWSSSYPRGPASVSELARPFNVALPTVVQHLGVLEAAGIVTSEKVGRVRTYQLVPESLAPPRTGFARQRLPAERRLDRLGTFLDHPPAKPTKECRHERHRHE